MFNKLLRQNLINDHNPEILLEIKLKYFDDFDHYFIIKDDIQKLYQHLKSNNKLKKNFRKKFIRKSPRSFLIESRKRNFFKTKHFKNYIYGCPSKKNLDELQINLRIFFSYENYVLFKIKKNNLFAKNKNFYSSKVFDNKDLEIKQIKRRSEKCVLEKCKLKNLEKENLEKENLEKSVFNEFILSTKVVNFYFKKFSNKLNLNENYELELFDYDFKIILNIIYSLYSGILYLNLNTLEQTFKFCYDFKIEIILNFLNEVKIKNDPLYLLNYLRKSLKKTELEFLIDSFKKIIINYDQIITYPGLLDLKFIEIDYLVSKKEIIFDVLKLGKRNEFNTLKAILDWYMVNPILREEECIFLLKKICFNNFYNDDLEKLINLYCLDGYTYQIKKALKNHFKLQIEQKKLNCKFYFQELISKNYTQEKFYIKNKVYQNKLDKDLSCNEKKIQSIKNDSELNNQDKIINLNDFIKNLISLGSYSITSTLSMYFNLNENSKLILLGGFDSYSSYIWDQGKSMYHLMILNNSTDKNINEPSVMNFDWFPLQEKLPCNLAHFASVKLENCIFVLGGLNLNQVLKNKNLHLIKPVSNCYIYNITSNCWYNIKNMNITRAFHSAVIYKHIIYVFGGLTSDNNLNVTNTMEFYNIEKNCWILVKYSDQNIPCPRMSFGMEIIKNLIFITGGLNNVDKALNYNTNSLLKDFWCYNILEKKFQLKKNLALPSLRSSFKLIKFLDELLVIGGIEFYSSSLKKILNKKSFANKTTNVVLACKLNLDNSYWYEHSKMNQPRIFPLVSSFLNSILVTSGKTQDHFYFKKNSLSNYCSTYEILNHDTKKWVENPIMFSTYGGSLLSLD